MTAERRSLSAEIRYELRTQHGPFDLLIGNQTIKIGMGEDAAVLVKQTRSGRTIHGEEIIAIMCSQGQHSSTVSFLQFRDYLIKSGEIALHPDLDFGGGQT